ncbi:MAG: RHS repeat-associated core domain-containing protein [Minicystis sp.]
MSQAAKFGDPVIGVDIHHVLIPTPGGPVPTPLPHPFIGYVWDWAGAAFGSVKINGMYAAGTGTTVKALVKHFPTPPGTGFAPDDVPDNEGSIVTGSKTVSFGGPSAARLGSMVSSCGFPLNLPTSTCLAIPMGAPVIVGGPDAMDWMSAVTRGIRTKWFSNALHKLLNPGKRLSWLICKLTGHPVDVVSGEVLTHSVDFELPGPIPIVFERLYYSRDRYEGPLGPAWHHPLDASVHETGQRVKVRLPDGRESPHDPIPAGESVWDPIDRYTLAHTRQGYTLTFWDGRSYHFEPVKGAAVSHALLKITDRCENVIALRYTNGRLAEVTDTMGRRLAFAYTGGRLVSVRLLRRSDGEWMDLCRYAYDAEGRLAEAIDPAGHAMRYVYKGGVLVKETNRNGLSFYFEYDWYSPDGMCVRTWGDGGILDRRITYDEPSLVTVVDDSRGGRTHYYGNPAGLVDREVDATGRETKYEWDPRCYQKAAEIDGLGNRTEWAYDERGNLIVTRDALGHETRWTYSALNVPVEHLDAAGSVWTRTYDARGKLTKVVDPLGDAIRLKHDRRGNPVSVEDPRGQALRLTYTDAGEIAEMVDREGHATRYELDDRGGIARMVDPLGGETRVARDVCGRPTAVRRPDGSWLRVGYDPEGNIIKQTDGLGNVTRFRYGGLNKLVERVDPIGGVVRYTFDTEEDLIGVTNELGEEYRIEVDKAGRVIKEQGFDGRALELWYDKAGRCIEMVNGQTRRTKMERNALGRVVKQVVPRSPVLGDPLPKGHAHEYAYDALGRLVRAKNEAAEVLFARDALGRVVEERVNGHVVESRYDGAGNRVGRRTSLGHEASYDFDGNGALLGVTVGVDPRWMDFSPASLAAGGAVREPWQARFRRNAIGAEVERSLPGEVVARWERDSVGRPAVHRVFRDEAQVAATGYRWRSYEQIVALIDTQRGMTRFEHDARSYLVAAVRPDGSVEHRAPDAVGNVYRSPERGDRRYGKGGRLEEAGGVRYAHDRDGQLVEKVLPDGRSWKYAWDHAGQLEAVTRPDGEQVAFAYDALGRRVRKTFAGKTTTFVWDGDDLVHEIAEAAEPVTWVFEPGTFAPLAKIEGKERYSIVTDHLGAPEALLDEAGELAWKAQLDVYGAARADVMKTRCPWRWPGQYEDEETGLYYNRFRYYDPEASRYVSQDPIGLKGGLELYGYVDDPLIWMDPLGLARGLWNLTREVAEATMELGNRIYYRSPADHLGDVYWWSKDTAGHGGSAFKVFQKEGNELVWVHDADKFGDWIDPNRKHKGPTGRKMCAK